MYIVCRSLVRLFVHAHGGVQWPRRHFFSPACASRRASPLYALRVRPTPAPRPARAARAGAAPPARAVSGLCVRPAPGGRCADRGPRSVRGARRPGAPAPRRCAAVRGAGGRAGRRQARALAGAPVCDVWCAVRPGPDPRISDVRAEPIRVVWSPPCMSVPLSSNQHVTRSTGPRSRARAEPPSRS